ncbi:hypothetical protein TIFTF001_022746 [Ficus carica]|uniref:Uncharacterized protein n=1 Tax=Ficus carica TaxID=3494 RepID=A0AA88ATX3_FICCA|nr:hypothetical protein TIFTF001_022746 [Ficus carica]
MDGWRVVEGEKWRESHPPLFGWREDKRERRGGGRLHPPVPTNLHHSTTERMQALSPIKLENTIPKLIVHPTIITKPLRGKKIIASGLLPILWLAKKFSGHPTHITAPPFHIVRAPYAPTSSRLQIIPAPSVLRRRPREPPRPPPARDFRSATKQIADRLSALPYSDAVHATPP